MKFGLASLRRWIAERRSRRALHALLASLDGKSVAIVGNATSLLAHRHGALIDGHDVVVRMNMGFPVDRGRAGRALRPLVLLQLPRDAAGAGWLRRAALGLDVAQVPRLAGGASTVASIRSPIGGRCATGSARGPRSAR